MKIEGPARTALLALMASVLQAADRVETTVVNVNGGTEDYRSTSQLLDTAEDMLLAAEERQAGT